MRSCTEAGFAVRSAWPETSIAYPAFCATLRQFGEAYLGIYLNNISEVSGSNGSRFV